MINRIIRKMNFLLLKKSIGRYSQFSKLTPFDTVSAAQLKESIEILRPHYDQYVNEVSAKEMAVSLELAGFILAVCTTNKFHKLLDMGSGFSSFVFRFYAKSNPYAKVFSVDDDELWLEKTKAYLAKHQLQTSQMYTLNAFLNSGEKDFDFILHDLNFVEVRINYVDALIERISQNGLIIFDDVHKPDYLLALLRKLKMTSANIFNLKNVTLDGYGRYAIGLLKR